MKVLLVFSLLLVCINAVKDLLPFLCYIPKRGPICSKMYTYYWDPHHKKCLLSKYLKQPCGIFYDDKVCNEVCTKKVWSMAEAEMYVKTLD